VSHRSVVTSVGVSSIGVSSVGVASVGLIGRCLIGRCLSHRSVSLVGQCLIVSCHRFVSIVFVVMCFYLTVSHVSVCLRDRCVSSPVWVSHRCSYGLSHLTVGLSLIGTHLMARVSCIGDLLSPKTEPVMSRSPTKHKRQHRDPSATQPPSLYLSSTPFLHTTLSLYLFVIELSSLRSLFSYPHPISLTLYMFGSVQRPSRSFPPLSPPKSASPRHAPSWPLTSSGGQSAEFDGVRCETRHHHPSPRRAGAHRFSDPQVSTLESFATLILMSAHCDVMSLVSRPQRRGRRRASAGADPHLGLHQPRGPVPGRNDVKFCGLPPT
jgi:hypothetical protein